MKITTRADYRQALFRIHELRSDGATANNHEELAELDAAVAAYESQPREPDESKAKPTPDPYDELEGSDDAGDAAKNKA
jgi:hypothetical protein